MEPGIKDRALIVADLSQKELIDKAIYILHYENMMWVKQYNLENETFVSINPDFSHLVYKKEDINLVARVLLTFTNL